MLRGLTKISSQHVLGKRISFVAVCAKLGKRLTKDGVVMGIGVGGALISFFSADTFNEKKEEQVKEIIGELKRLLRSTTSLREPKKRSVDIQH